MRRQHHIRLLSVIVVAALLLAVTGGGQALAQGTPPAPVLPQSFWGSVKDASGNPILSGTVEAWMNGVKQDSIEILNGQYGGPGGFDKRLVVQGTSEDIGETIEFYVNGVKANETAKYTPGEKTNLNLTALEVQQPPKDTTPPAVVSTDPVNDATSVPVDKTIRITFSEELQEGTTYNAISVKDNNDAAVAVAKSIEGKVLNIKSNVNLAYNTKYTVTIPAGAVKDLTGNALAQEYVFSFTTQAAPDTTPPAVANSDPANNATGVSVNKTITVTFSEDVQQGTAYDAISLKDAAGKVVEVTKSITGKVLSIKPNANLAYSTKYTVVIPAGAVKDQAGNVLEQSYSFGFNTEAAPVIPPGGGGGSSGGGGGGGGTAPSSSTDKVEKTVQAGKTTVAEISGKVKVEVPAGAVTGANAAVVVEVLGDEKAANAGMPLLSRVVDIVLKNGTLNGKVTITLHFDSSKLGKDQQAAAFYYNEKQGKWVGLEGTVDVEKGTVAVTVDHLTMFAAFAKPKFVDFKDMQGHWATEAVEKLAGMGIITGYPDGTFKPNNKITRAEITAILVRALKLSPANAHDLKFADNASIPAWAREMVATALKEGLVKGYPKPNGEITFEANRPVSRAEMAVLVTRIMEKKKSTVKTAELKFVDNVSIPEWAKTSIEMAVGEGIIQGYPDNTFRAEREITRAEVAAMLLRMLDTLEN